MKVCYAKQSKGFRWSKGGEDIKYGISKIVKKSAERKRNYYMMSFTFDFKEAEDKIYFSYCFPYSFSALSSFL
jgi:hypothetical protein